MDKCTTKDVHTSLNHFSKGSALLDRAYDEAIKRIEGQLPGISALAKSTLSWITYAERPLTTKELCHALAVEPYEDGLDTANVPHIQDLISFCAGLVTVDEESDTIRLVHYTTQEYFERIREEWSPSAQLDIASTCLRYLSFSSFKSGSCSTDKALEDRRGEYPLLDYAACHWAYHAFAAQKGLLTLARNFLECDGLVSCAVQISAAPRFKIQGYSQHYPTGRTALHLLAWFGLNLLLEQLIYTRRSEYATSCSLEDGTGSTPLNLAVARGHTKVVELLVKEGANINARNAYHGDALQVAACNGHEDIVKLLLSKGAVVNAKSGNFGNALQAAAFRGHQQVVKLLLHEGAEVNTQGGQYMNALQAASFKGHKQIVELLFDNGAEVNPQGDDSNVLQSAVQEGHDQIVELLLDKGAKVGAQGGCYGNALQTASYKGFTQIVKLLLKAAYIGHENIVELLLENGADINMESGLFGSALQGASYGGHEQIAELLLNANADVNVQSGDYGSALQVAAYNGHTRIVKLLLSRGANVNAQGGYYGSAIQAAACNDHAQVVKLLLNSGADVNAQRGYYGSAISAAVCNGHQNVFQLLLENGVKVNVEDIAHKEELLFQLTGLQIEPRETGPSGVDKHRRYGLYRRYLRMRRIHIS